MRTSHFALAGLVAATALSSCNCDEVLGSRTLEAELSFGEARTPPLPLLEIDVGRGAVGTDVETTIFLENVGTLPLTIAGVSLGPDPERCPRPSTEYTIVSSTPSTVNAGDKAPITIRFRPQSGAPSCAAVFANTDDATNPSLEALFTGQGDAGGLCADRAVIDFGEVLLGETKDDVVTLTSCGTKPVSVEGLVGNTFFAPSGPFSFDPPALPAALPPGSTLDVPVHFSPTLPVRHALADQTAGLLDVGTDLAGQAFQIALVGVGKAPPACVLDAVPAALQFGAVEAESSTTAPIVLRNLGELPCTLASLALRDGVDEFTFSAPGFSADMVLAPSASLSVDVTFQAPAEPVSADNALVVVSDDPAQPTREVPIAGEVTSGSGCVVRTEPLSVDFGAVALNTLRAREIVVTNIGEDPCFVTDTAIGPGSDPGFVDTSSDFGAIFPGNNKTFTVAYRPTAPTTGATGTFDIDVSDSFFGGTSTTVHVPLTAFTGTSGICVTPRHIDFGNVTTPQTATFQVSACASSTVVVQGLDFTQADAEITLPTPPTLPLTLVPGDAITVTVSYAPTDDGGDTAELSVRSDDPVTPSVPVTVTGGHTIVPPEAGRFLYFWQIPGSGIVGGDVMKLPLQGDATPRTFWGPRNGKGCAGCHSISPDGKYVAVVEVGTMRFVEAETDLELFLGDTQFLDPTSFSWRPNIDTTPPYQFAYSDGADVRIGSLFDGDLGPLAGADDGTVIETMPSWGPDGTIAFVRGASAATTSDGSFGLQGPTDVLLIDENGGAPVPLVGASGNGMANYYPAFAPNGLWIAFTQSPSAASTIAAEDAHIRLAPADNSGNILALPALNSDTGPSSYTTWSVNGRFLSFASKRTGGAGNWDLYLGSIDPLSGVDSDLRPLTEVNTADFEHAAQWSP